MSAAVRGEGAPGAPPWIRLCFYRLLMFFFQVTVYLLCFQVTAGTVRTITGIKGQISKVKAAKYATSEDDVKGRMPRTRPTLISLNYLHYHVWITEFVWHNKWCILIYGLFLIWKFLFLKKVVLTIHMSLKAIKLILIFKSSLVDIPALLQSFPNESTKIWTCLILIGIKHGKKYFQNFYCHSLNEYLTCIFYKIRFNKHIIVCSQIYWES